MTWRFIQVPTLHGLPEHGWNFCQRSEAGDNGMSLSVAALVTVFPAWTIPIKQFFWGRVMLASGSLAHNHFKVKSVVVYWRNTN
jgi:hypothetical protein